MEKDAPTGLPQYFLIEAQLLDAASKPVSPLCTDRSHTQAYQAFASKTPEDYPADQVLDFGDDGFAVLPKGTQRAGVAEKTAGGYAVPAMTALPSPGDIVALTLNGATVPVKVKSASVQGGKTIIVPDGDASLAELYDSLRVDVSVDLGGAASGQALSAKSGGEGGAGGRDPAQSINITIPLRHNMRLESTGDLRLDVHTFFDKDMDPEYIEQSKLLTGEGTLSLISESEKSTDMIKDALALELAETPAFPLGTTGLAASVKVTAPLSFNVTTQSRIDTHYTLRAGDVYIEGKGFQEVRESDFRVDAATSSTTIKEFSASLGLQASIALGSVVSAFPLEATADYQVGGRFVSKRDTQKESNGIRHACQLCCDERVTVFQEISATLACDLGKLNIPLVKLTVPIVEKPLSQGYHSYLNDPDSPLKGKDTQGSGDCPNKQYLVSVTARNTAGEPVTGMAVTAVSQTSGKTTSGTVPASFWLYAAQHLVSAEIDGRMCKNYFTPSATERTLELQPQPVTLSVNVTDKATGASLEGAAVTVTDLSDPAHPREAGSGTANSRGYFSAKLLPGVYRVEASMKDYKTASEEKTITGSAPGPVDLKLEREKAYAALTVNVLDSEGKPVSAYVTFRSDEYNTVTATGAAGTVTQKFLPPGTYTVSVPASGGYGAASKTVTLAPGQEGSVTLTVSSGTGTLKGTVADGDGNLLSGVSVTVSQDGKTVKTTTTDSGGAYATELPTGTYTITASLSGYASQCAEVTILKDQTAMKDFVLGGTGTLKVAVMDSLGKILSKPGITFRAGDTEGSWLSWPWVSHPVSGNQIYTFPGVPAGACQITASPEGYLPKTVEVNIEKGKTIQVNIVVHKGDIQWSLDEASGTLTISGTGEMDDYAVPGTQPPWYDKRGSITSIVVEEGVTRIGDHAFINYTNLAALSLPSTLKEIGGKAFAYDAALPAVSFPEGLTALGAYAFQDCTALTGVTVPSGVASMGSGVFSGCSNLTRAALPNGIKEVGASMFSGCKKLTSATIPQGAALIGAYAFYGCSSLEDISIPQGVTSIGNQAFRECSALRGIVLPSGVTSIGEYAFADCAALISVGLPDTLTSIGKDAFSSCSALIGVTIPNSVASIGSYAFTACTSLTDITIPNSVTELGSCAFSSCSKLAWAVIGDNLTVIESKTFWNCENLGSVQIGKNVESIGGGAFYHCDALTDIVIPDSVKAIGGEIKYYDSQGTWNCEGAFQDCQNLRSVTLPSRLESVGDRAFQNCAKLTGIRFPAALTSIGRLAFRNCGLENVVLPDSLTKIGRSAFSLCEHLTSITIPGGITVIPTELLFRCTSLHSVSIPEGVITIEDSVFDDCSSLLSIYLPASLESIAKCLHWDNYYKNERPYNFLHKCENMQTIYYAGTEVQWANVVMGMADQFPESVEVICSTPVSPANEIQTAVEAMPAGESPSIEGAPATEEVPSIEEALPEEEVPPIEEAPPEEEVPPIDEAPSKEEILQSFLHVHPDH